MHIREIKLTDSEEFLELCNLLEIESNSMMYK
jgi:hypothetical protein